MRSTILIGSRPAYKCPVARVLKCSSVWVAAISLGPDLAIPADWARPRVCPMVRLFRWGEAICCCMVALAYPTDMPILAVAEPAAFFIK